ncbi:MAG: biopolymer transporter ExbD [Pirellulales bacterium]|nr:biopolymer transporter ExbD [Pirellulales bacterium]
MTIRFHCAHCNKRLKVDDGLAGRRGKCPRCGQSIEVPQDSEPQKSQTAALTPAEILAEDEEGAMFAKRTFAGDEEMDMTPMVDMTFLLLIFFICTSTFNLQKSIDMPVPDPTDTAAQARTIEELEEDNDYIVVRIEGDNTVWVEDAAAYSEIELLTKLRELKAGSGGRPGATRLMVMASGDAAHETVVRVLDSGTAVGMESIRLSSMADDE